MAGIKGVTRTKQESQKLFLEKLEQTGNVTMSAKAIKLSRRTVYQWLEDGGFKKRFEASAKIGVELLEDEAQRRAFHGVNKPVYHGGKKVGVVTEYSDTLLIFLLKGRKKEVYADRHELTGANGAPIETKMVIQIVNTGPEPASSEKNVELD